MSCWRGRGRGRGRGRRGCFDLILIRVVDDACSFLGDGGEEFSVGRLGPGGFYSIEQDLGLFFFFGFWLAIGRRYFWDGVRLHGDRLGLTCIGLVWGSGMFWHATHVQKDRYPDFIGCIEIAF